MTTNNNTEMSVSKPEKSIRTPINKRVILFFTLFCLSFVTYYACKYINYKNELVVLEKEKTELGIELLKKIIKNNSFSRKSIIHALYN